jgi:glycosyltransferase involved in cell wall biosynthesis
MIVPRRGREEHRATSALQVAYVCSQYPAVSHTFVMREVEGLRELGVRVDTFSIHRTPPAQLLTEADRAAFETTCAILPPRWTALMAAHVSLALSAPRAYAATLALALRLASPGLRGRLWQLFYFAEAVMLWSECRRRGLRHVHAHLANVAADVALLAAELGSRVDRARPWSWSFTMHGPTEFYDLTRFRLAAKLRFARFAVCISDFARSQLMAISDPASWCKLHVIHCGVPLRDFAGCVHQRPDACPMVLCVGRLVPEKGQAILLRAIAMLSERGRQLDVTFAGEGPSRARLERLAAELRIAERVTFLGAVGQDQISELYSSATIFCLPSFAEGLPVVLMEAMALGLAVVSTRIAGVPELIEDDRTGLLVAPGRADALADALARLLDDAALRRRLGSRARQRVSQDFDADRSARQLLALFAAQLAPEGAQADHQHARSHRPGEVLSRLPAAASAGSAPSAPSASQPQALDPGRRRPRSTAKAR